MEANRMFQITKENMFKKREKISYAHDLGDIWLPIIEPKFFGSKFASKVGDITDLKLIGPVLWILCQKWGLLTLWMRLSGRESLYQGK